MCRVLFATKVVSPPFYVHTLAPQTHTQTLFIRARTRTRRALALALSLSGTLSPPTWATSGARAIYASAYTLLFDL